MGKSLVIVESPAKAKTIGKYLGPDFLVESSIGHIRDLPSNAAEIPAEFKDEPWARLGVNVDSNFEPLYIVPKDKKAQVTKLRKLLKSADAVYLATDEDREGEAIAWHLIQVLNPRVTVRRMVFDEITKQAITAAVQNTREMDMGLVTAQETRRVLDRLVGYEVSPVLWRKVRPRLSAGRVQSVATRLIVERERARMRFVSSEYWDLDARVQTQGAKAVSIDVRLVELDGQRVASGKDFDEQRGVLKNPGSTVQLLEAEATTLAEQLADQPFRVKQIVAKPFNNRPHPPFITSTLQQEASRKLRFSAQRTMRLAQSLYENGHITYMRTDSTHLSTQALTAARTQIGELYGNEFLPDGPRTYKSRSKNAQEAHEAIRPAGESFQTPKQVGGKLLADEAKLYELIWKRTVASQMKDATGVRTSMRIEATTPDGRTAEFTASGKVIEFAGFLRAYVEGSDDPEAELEDKEKILPPLTEGEQLTAESVTPSGHTTQPPARYTDASLVKELEERGIGRPSTYASIIQTIQDRGYVWKKGTALVPTLTAFAVTALLEGHLPELVDYAFTAKMEDGLDAIASGERDAGPWLKNFYHGLRSERKNGDHIADIGLKELVGSSIEEIDARQVCSIEIGRDADGNIIAARVGKYGPYLQVGDGDQRATIPDDLAPDELTVERALALVAEAAEGDKVLGHHPVTGDPVYLKTGRFGPYVQLGDPELTEKGNIKKGSKPKMASLWPSMTMTTLTLEDAVLLLSFPREVGAHPETDEMITAQDGRFGPYIKMGTETRSLANHDQLRDITLAGAVELLKQPKGRRQSTGNSVVKELGAHPDTELPLQVKNGRFGPYVTDGVVNATIPKGSDPEKLTLDRAVELIAAREQKLRDQGKDPRAPKAKKTSSRSTAAKKKPSKKKPAAAAAKKKTKKASRKKPPGVTADAGA